MTGHARRPLPRRRLVVVVRARAASHRRLRQSGRARRAEVNARFGLTNAWLYVFEREDDEHAVLVAAAGAKAEAIRNELPIAPIAGDWLDRGAAPRRGPDRHPGRAAGRREPRGGAAPRQPNRHQHADRRRRSRAGNPRLRHVRRRGPGGDRRGGGVGLRPAGNMASVAVARLVLRSRDVARVRCRLSWPSASAWRAWACWRAGSRTTSTTC